MSGKEDKFDKYDEMGQLPGGYDVALAREAALKHAREQLSKEKNWLREAQLEWEISDARFDEEADCYRVILECYPDDADVETKSQWEYHIDATGKLYPGTPMLISRGKWGDSQSDLAKTPSKVSGTGEAIKSRKSLLIFIGILVIIGAVVAGVVMMVNSSDDTENATEPDIVLSPLSGPVGSTLTITGTEFPPLAYIESLTISDVSLLPPGTVMTDSDGSFTEQVTVPGFSLGSYEINAEVGGKTATAAFSVIQEPIQIPTCTAGWMCDGDTRYYLSTDCTKSNRAICEYGCQGGECIPPPPSASTLEMTSIPSGTFNIGSNDGDPDEKPVHSVTLSPFNMSKYEITYAQWVKVRNWGNDHGYQFENQGIQGSKGYDSSSKQDDSHPVTSIDWHDAVKWCNALSEMEGRLPCYYTSSSQFTVYRTGTLDIQNDWVKWNANGYRLPTESEWEYACRAGTTTKYSIGNSISGNSANYWNSGDSYDNGATPVGSYVANAWGLYDMHGNVWEWCWDWYGLYSSSLESNPRGPSVGSDRVVRGGGWDDWAEDLRSAVRIYDNSDDHYTNRGFRPVRS